MASDDRDFSGDRGSSGYRDWSLAGWREHKCPKRVFRRAALPRNHVGKIVRSALR